MADRETVVLISYGRSDVFKPDIFGVPSTDLRVAVNKWLKRTLGPQATYMSMSSEERPWRQRTWRLGKKSTGQHAFIFYKKRDAALFMVRWQGELLSPAVPVELL